MTTPAQRKEYPKSNAIHVAVVALAILASSCSPSIQLPAGVKHSVYHPGKLKPVDSESTLKLGQKAPDFSLPSVSGRQVSLAQFRGKKNVVLAFVPAAFTPVCSSQFPGYNIALDMFDQNDTVLLGLTADNIPSLHAWETSMGGLDFELLSDFWPHGQVASRYGVLRRDGTSERALVVIDKLGVIRYIDVHDINKRPPLEDLAEALSKLK